QPSPISASSSMIAVLCMDAGISETAVVGRTAFGLRTMPKDQPDEKYHRRYREKYSRKSSADRRNDQPCEPKQSAPLEDTEQERNDADHGTKDGVVKNDLLS